MRRKAPDPLRIDRISVIVATYNRAEYLRLCLACLANQDYASPFDIVVADDGSSDHTATVIEEGRHPPPSLRIIHVTQEDRGFRKTLILNEAVRKATGDLMVFLDSDCMPCVDLLSVYAAHAAPDSFYLGGICKLNRSYAEQTLSASGSPDPKRFLLGAAQRQNQLPRQRVRLLRRYLKSKLSILFRVSKPKIWGGNFAINRAVLEAVNGFDENYIGWGREESDLRNRLILGGYRGVALHSTARAYHLWHPKDWSLHIGSDGERCNLRYYKRPDLTVVCRNGLKKR